MMGRSISIDHFALHVVMLHIWLFSVKLMSAPETALWEVINKVRQFVCL